MVGGAGGTLLTSRHTPLVSQHFALYVHMYIHVHMYIYVYMYIYLHMYICAYVCRPNYTAVRICRHALRATVWRLRGLQASIACAWRLRSLHTLARTHVQHIVPVSCHLQASL